MRASYTSNYFKIYFWQGVAIVLNFLSMLIVTPRLAEFPSIYGIYAFCFSTAVFFTYADLGFLGAGYKYVSECFARNNRDEEIKILGFVSFILFIFIALYACVIMVIAKNPSILISNINSQYEFHVASRLLMILAIFSPVIILQRFAQTVCGIRLEDFIYQRISIVCSLIKLLSVFYFFRPDHYDIVGYFLFFQLINLFGAIFIVLVIKNRYCYNLNLLLKAFRLSREVYYKTKKLAFSSLYVTITFVIFFEFDLIAIAKFLGPREVAFYAIGLTLLSVFRSIYGVLYGPFAARINHFIGIEARNVLKDLYKNIIILTMPLVIFPLLSIFILMEPLIYSWVGYMYAPSLIIARLLILCFIYSFISYPASMLIMAQEKIKLLYSISSILMVIFWTGVLLTFHIFSINAFALFKFIAFTVSAAIYLFVSIRFVELRFIEFLKKLIGPILIPCLFLVTVLLYLSRFMPQEQSKLNVIIVIFTGGAVSFLSACLYYLFSTPFRCYVNQTLKKLSYSRNLTIIIEKLVN